MSRTLEAIVDGDVLRPLEQLGLPDQERVVLTIVRLEHPQLEPSSDCFTVAKALGIIGIAKDLPADLSSNPDHLEGLGA